MMDEDGLGAERKAILAQVAQESEERDRGTRRVQNSPGGSTTDAQTVRTSRETARNPRPVGTCTVKVTIKIKICVNTI